MTRTDKTSTPAKGVYHDHGETAMDARVAALEARVKKLETPTPSYTFIDNFDGTLSQWGHHYTCCGSVKVDPALSYTANGQLHIRAENRSGTWYSGLVDTVGTFAQQYGKFEASITVPQGAGLWPAFWLYAGSFGTDGDEIDIVELLGKEKMQGAHQTVHKTTQSNEVYAPWSSIIPPNGGATWADGKPHVFACDWRADHIAFLIDGRETWRESSLLISKPLSIILNLGVGGSWAGTPDSTTPSPVEMLVDYVRTIV